MPTTIYFAAGDKLSVRVAESPEDVQGKLTENSGLPVALTSDRSGAEPVFVNPAAVAYWGEAHTGRASFS